jgi:hypothetical protein
MRVSCIEFETSRTVQECASTFRDAIQTSCGGGRGTVRGRLTSNADSSVIKFFTPKSSPFGSVNGGPAWSAGVLVPGDSKLDGARRIAIHIYVVDHGATREVQVVGPYGDEDKGSTGRLLRSIARCFSGTEATRSGTA